MGRRKKKIDGRISMFCDLGCSKLWTTRTVARLCWERWIKDLEQKAMEEIVEPPATSGKKTKKKVMKQDPAPPPESAHHTRSQAAPDWTQQETLVLVGVIVAVDENWLNSLSSYQKWKMISDESTGLGVHRSSHQCKRRWESLVGDYGRISDWEQPRSGGVCSYWSLDSEGRMQYGLPPLFDREVFDSMDAAIKAWEDRSRDSGTEDAEVEMADADVVDSGPTTRKIWKDEEKAREVAANLQERVERVYSVLRGELTGKKDSRGRALVDMTKPNAVEIEFARRQADELIGAVDDLVGTLSCFSELIEDGERDGIRPAANTWGF